jgi:hypothetical protein
MSNRHIECGAGVLLQQKMVPVHGRMFVISSNSNSVRLTGDSIVNCNFLGTNSVPPKADWDVGANQTNIAIETIGPVDNFFLAGNTFDQFYGQSMFQTYAAVDGGHGDQIIYNTFKNCGYYGPVFDAHNNGYIAHNSMIDCAAGVENDNANQNTGGNIIEYNTLTCVHGYGTSDMNACTMLTGGAAGGADYTTNIVRNNSLSGVSDAKGTNGAGLPSLLYTPANRKAQYSNNSCTNGCRVQ